MFHGIALFRTRHRGHSHLISQANHALTTPAVTPIAILVQNGPTWTNSSALTGQIVVLHLLENHQSHSPLPKNPSLLLPIRNLPEAHHHSGAVQLCIVPIIARINQSLRSQFSNHQRNHFNHLAKCPRRLLGMQRSHVTVVVFVPHLRPSSSLIKNPNINVFMSATKHPVPRQHLNPYDTFLYLS